MSKHLMRQQLVWNILEAKQLYDLVITDYRMTGGITGLYLASTIKKHARKKKVFLMTSFDIPSSPESIDTLEARIVDEPLKNRFHTKN
jgi:hypothetical protein